MEKSNTNDKTFFLDLNSGPVLARQAFYHLSHSTSQEDIFEQRYNEDAAGT
jgi:hypothetical protein